MKKNTKKTSVIKTMISTAALITALGYYISKESNEFTRKLKVELLKLKVVLDDLLKMIQEMFSKLENIKSRDMKESIKKELITIRNSLLKITPQSIGEEAKKLFEKAKQKLGKLDDQIKSEKIHVKPVQKTVLKKSIAPSNLSKMTVDELKKVAKNLGIKFSKSIRKIELIKMIKETK